MSSNLPVKVPDVSGSPLEGSPHLELIYHMLCSNWHPWRVASEIKRRYGLEYPPEAIRDLLEQIDESELLPGGALVRHFRNNQVISDPLMELHMLLRFSRERLEHAVEIEQAENEMLSAQVENMLQKHWDRAIQFQELVEQVEGRVPVDWEREDTDNRPTLRELYHMKAKRVTVREVTIENETDNPGLRTHRGTASDELHS